MAKVILSPLTVALALLLVAVFVLRRDRQSARGWRGPALPAVVGTLVVLVVASLPLVANGLVLSLERGVQAPPAGTRLDAVFIPGGDVRRVPCGMVASTDYGAQWLVLPKSKQWAELVVALGFDEARVVQEPLSRNTHQEAVNLQRVTQLHRNDRIGVATDAWHLPRAFGQIRHYFPNAVGIPCYKRTSGVGFRSFLPHADALAETTRALNEYFGRAWYALRY